MAVNVVKVIKINVDIPFNSTKEINKDNNVVDKDNEEAKGIINEIKGKSKDGK